MNDHVPPGYLPPPPGPGMGCVAKGCLTLVVVGILLLVMFGGIGWYVARNFTPFLSQHPAAIRVFPATDTQYQAVQDKLAPFVQTVNAGHAATLTLTADDINILIARDPQYSPLRGKAYLSIANNELSMETNVLLNEDAPASQRIYFHGRAVCNASFASGDFTLVLRRLEPLDGTPPPSMVEWFIKQEGFSRSFSRGFNDSFHEGINKNASAADFLGRLRTIIVKDNQIIITAQENPGAVAVPPASR